MRKLSFLLFLFALISLTGCQKEEEGSGAMSDDAVSIAVEIQTVETTSFTRTRAYVGNVSASKSVKVIPLASEQILKYSWENGDYIEKGEVVAEIRNAVSRKGLDALNAQMKSLDAQLGAAQREFKRVQSMYESNIVSRQNYDQAQDAVTTLQASKLQLQASMEQSRMGLDYARVVAPISGVISQKNSEVGDIASSAMPLCVLLQLDPLKVTLNVNEEDVVYLKADQEIKLKFDAYPGEIVTARIKRIMPYVNTTTRTNVVEAEFDNPGEKGNRRYKPGMYVRAEVDLETTTDAIAVSPTALLLEPDLLVKQVPGQTLRRAYVLKDDMTVEAREIEIGEQNGNIVEILSGLKAGEKLVTRGQHSLKDGDRVNIKNQSKSAAPIAKNPDSGANTQQPKPAEPAPNPIIVAPEQNPANESVPVPAVADNPAADSAPVVNPNSATKPAAAEGN